MKALPSFLSFFFFFISLSLSFAQSDCTKQDIIIQRLQVELTAANNGLESKKNYIVALEKEIEYLKENCREITASIEHDSSVNYYIEVINKLKLEVSNANQKTKAIISEAQIEIDAAETARLIEEKKRIEVQEELMDVRKKANEVYYKSNNQEELAKEQANQATKAKKEAEQQYQIEKTFTTLIALLLSNQSERAFLEIGNLDRQTKEVFRQRILSLEEMGISNKNLTKAKEIL